MGKWTWFPFAFHLFHRSKAPWKWNKIQYQVHWPRTDFSCLSPGIGVVNSWPLSGLGQYRRPVPKVPDVGQIGTGVGIRPEFQASVDQGIVHTPDLQVLDLWHDPDFYGWRLGLTDVVVCPDRDNKSTKRTNYCTAIQIIFWPTHYFFFVCNGWLRSILQWETSANKESSNIYTCTTVLPTISKNYAGIWLQQLYLLNQESMHCIWQCLDLQVIWQYPDFQVIWQYPD